MKKLWHWRTVIEIIVGLAIVAYFMARDREDVMKFSTTPQHQPAAQVDAKLKSLGFASSGQVHKISARPVGETK